MVHLGRLLLAYEDADQERNKKGTKDSNGSPKREIQTKKKLGDK